MKDSVEFKAFQQLQEKKKLAVLLNANICPQCGEGRLEFVIRDSSFGPADYVCIGPPKSKRDDSVKPKVSNEFQNKSKKRGGCGYMILDRHRREAIREGEKLEV